jgi:retron-type reverse transcriptase
VEEIASGRVLDAAYAWLCQARRKYPAHDDVWNLRWRWAETKAQLQAELLAGTYRISPVCRRKTSSGLLDVWAAQDALVLKATAIVLRRRLNPHLSPHCYHLSGHSGLKGAVRAVAANLAANRFVFRTDVKSYYASIEHDILYDLLRPLINDGRVLALLWQNLGHLVYEDGFYCQVGRGICRGSPLSPLLGALFLGQIDERLAALGLFYARFMDDWVILAPSRWKLRKAIRTVNQGLAELKVSRHPDKTFIGRIERGFDFVGYRFSSQGLGIAPQAMARFRARLARLYEQDADVDRIGQYVRRWWGWAQAGVSLDEGLSLPTHCAGPW